MNRRSRKQFHNKIISFVLVICMICGLAAVVIPFSYQNEMIAATFHDINQSSVFLKQSGRGKCTIASAAMLLRRAAMLNGNESWYSITEATLSKVAWMEGVGLRHSFTYEGITVSYGSDLNGDKDKLIELLKEHPEGIVIYNRSLPHAILVTDYTDGVFYCAETIADLPDGRIPISQASINVESATCYWYVSSPKLQLETSSYNPEGCVDLLESIDGKIFANGWVFDRDMWTDSVSIEIWVEGVFIGAYTANAVRSDIGQVYAGAGDYHGFAITVPVDVSGWQRVEIRAKNIGNGSDVSLVEKDIYISAVPNGENEESVKIGDMNRDEAITLRDVQIVLNLALGILQETENDIRCADVNQDGAISLEDAQQLLKIALGIC